jgi:hypothetical protein
MPHLQQAGTLAAIPPKFYSKTKLVIDFSKKGYTGSFFDFLIVIVKMI